MPLLAKNSLETQKVLSQIVAKTWLDEEFNSQFHSNTNVVLEENGLTLPNNVEFSVNENTLVGIQKSVAESQDSNVVYEIPLPTKPTGLTDQSIQSWSSGNNYDDEEGSSRISY